MMVSMVMEFNMWCDSFTAMNILLMVMVLDWVHNFTVNDFMMVVWSFMVHIVVNFVDMGWLMMVYVMMIVNIVVNNFMVYWLHMVDVNIMMIKIVIAMVIVDIMDDMMSMTNIFKVVKLI